VLSRHGIVAEVTALLDAGGEEALTVRALAERLSTGSGAIYYRVGPRSELLNAATETVVEDVLARPGRGVSPSQRIRDLALGLFDAVDEHPWLATQLVNQLTRRPWGAVTMGIFETIGSAVRSMGIPRPRWFDATATLVHFILGALSQNARTEPESSDPGAGPDRGEFLSSVSIAWRALDPDQFPFLHEIADDAAEHDDRQQFVRGISTILRGIEVASDAPTEQEQGASDA